MNTFYRTVNGPVQKLYDTCLEKCRANIKMFGGDRVLVEGGGYEKIWLETQPMGGEMFAAYDLTAAFNNSYLFLKHQRTDGRMPGSIRCTDGEVVPEYNKFQGFCFPWHALNLYYLTDRDEHYLSELKQGLEGMHEYLNHFRKDPENGALRSFCVYDTGEDHAVRFGDSPNYWTEDAAPAGFSVVPIDSMDVTSWDYAILDTLREIAQIRGDETLAEKYEQEAGKVREGLKRVFWHEEKKAAYDRDAKGQVMPQLIHNNLRCMYWGSFDQAMADGFVRGHLCNETEFWTPLPLPSVAVSDPDFRNAPENNWSGQCEGLTFQRAIQALERYGYFQLVTEIGKRFTQALIRGGYIYTQQFDPFTGKPSRVGNYSHAPLREDDTEPFQDAYGPTMLAALEYLAHREGIDVHRDTVLFSAAGGDPFTYQREAMGKIFLLESDGTQAKAYVNGELKTSFDAGNRLITDMNGNMLGREKIV